jgi:hypothetical protein
VTIVVSSSGMSFFDCPFGLRYSLTFRGIKKKTIQMKWQQWSQDK